MVTGSKTQGLRERVLSRSETKMAGMPADKFSRYYGRVNKKAFKEEGDTKSGFLTEGCTVQLVDYGRKQGRPVVDSYGQACKKKEDFEALLKPRDDWEKAYRWIDVEGFNGEVIQHCLALMSTNEQVVFNMLVDPNQQSITLDLDPECEDEATVLFTATKATLTAAATKLLDDSTAKLYASTDDKDRDFDLVSLENMSILCKMTKRDDSTKRQTGLLITIQQGGVRDDTFESTRNDIQSFGACPGQPDQDRDVVWVLMRLIRACSNSLYEVVNYLDQARSQLENDMCPYRDRTDRNVWRDFGEQSGGFMKAARSMENECLDLVRSMVPMKAALQEFADGYTEMLGNTATAWRALAVQNRSLVGRLRTCEASSRLVMQLYKDIQLRHLHEQHERLEKMQARADRGQRMVGLVLGVFSPLGFLSGVYGMNFVKTDTSPSIPELSWGWALEDPSDTNTSGTNATSPTPGVIGTGLTGYGYFWVLIGCVVIVIITLYMALGLIPTPKACWDMWRGRRDEEEVEDDRPEDKE